MRRVVVTGMGIVSSIGDNVEEVADALREGRSGVVRAEKYAELGFRCQVHGAPTLNAEEAIDRRALRFLGGGAAWNHIAMAQAIRDAGLEEHDISHEMTGIIMGSGGPSTRAIVEAADVARAKGPKRARTGGSRTRSGGRRPPALPAAWSTGGRTPQRTSGYQIGSGGRRPPLARHPYG